MRLPVSWLKDYVEVKVSPEKLAELYTMSGTVVKRVETAAGEPVLDIEVTTNRPDCLSVLGLAGELSALTGAKVRFPKIGPDKKSEALKVEILDKKGCLFYTLRRIQNITAGTAPEAARLRIGLSGARVLSNVVDATNFVLFETGQPLHAFDADKIRGGKLIVRRAKKDEKFLGIDGNAYILDEKTLVIADAERAIAMAGVMGGRSTEITPQTKNVFLESAYFEPALVRQAAKRYKISTESSYRFERGVDSQNVERASARARDLILEWAGGSETGRGSAGSPKILKKNITLRLSRLEKFLGMKITAARAASILKNLGFSVKRSGNDKLSVAFWNARRDIVQEVDLIEEILRIEGFDRLPVLIPVTRHTAGASADPRLERVMEVKKFVVALGFNEIVTYSLLSRKLLEDAGHDLSSFKPHRLVNTPSAEQEYFRPNLFTGTLQTVAFNLHRKASSMRLFETGNCCLNGVEETMLALSLCGPTEENWLRKSESSFHDLKGAAEDLMHFLSVPQLQWRDAGPNALFDANSELWSGDERIGELGRVTGAVLKSWDIPKDVFYFQCSFDKIQGLKKAGTVIIKPVSKFQAVRRDVAFIVEEGIAVGSLEDTMRDAASTSLSEVRLFDQFVGKNIPPGKRSLAFSLVYKKDDGTFTDEEIRVLQNKVADALKKNYRVEFR